MKNKTITMFYTNIVGKESQSSKQSLKMQYNLKISRKLLTTSHCQVEAFKPII